MTSPIELCKRGTDEVVAYACGKCGAIAGSLRSHGDDARDVAGRHCGPWLCRVCGKEHDWSYQTICYPCWREGADAREAQKNANAFAKATHVPAAEYDGGVTDGNEGYWASIEEAVEHYTDNDAPVPEYLWACRRVPSHIDADEVIEAALENHHEDAANMITNADATRLQVLLDDWCADINVESWEPDWSRAVVLKNVNDAADKGDAP